MKRILPLLLLPVFANAATLTVTSLADDGSAGTLRAQIAEAAAGDTIVFDEALAGGSVMLDKANGPLLPKVSLSLVGPEGRVTIDGGSNGSQDARTTQLLRVDDADVTFAATNVNFCGGMSDTKKDHPELGPAVACLGPASFASCDFRRNGMSMNVSPGEWNGGAALYARGSLSLEDCQFEDNSLYASGMSIGGALLIAGESATIRDCLFARNRGWKTVGGTTTA